MDSWDAPDALGGRGGIGEGDISGGLIRPDLKERARGGHAIVAKQGNTTVINSGSLVAGFAQVGGSLWSNSGRERMSAVYFAGGGNKFEVRNGSTITGTVEALGGVNDTFLLGGALTGLLGSRIIYS